MAKPDGQVLKKPLKRDSKCKGNTGPSPGPIPPLGGYTLDCATACPASTTGPTVDTHVYNVAWLSDVRFGYRPTAVDTTPYKGIAFVGGYGTLGWNGDYIDFYDTVNLAVNEILLSPTIPEPAVTVFTPSPSLPPFQVRFSNNYQVLFYFETGAQVNSTSHYAIALDGSVRELSTLFSQWTTGPTASNALYIFDDPNRAIIVVHSTGVDVFSLQNNAWSAATFDPTVSSDVTPISIDANTTRALEVNQFGEVYLPDLGKVVKFWVYFDSGTSTWKWGYTYLFERLDGTTEDPFAIVGVPPDQSQVVGVIYSAKYAPGTAENPTHTGDGFIYGPSASDTWIQDRTVYIDELRTEEVIEEHYPLTEFCDVGPDTIYAFYTSFEAETGSGNILTWNSTIDETNAPNRIYVAYFLCENDVGQGNVMAFVTPFREPVWFF